MYTKAHQDELLQRLGPKYKPFGTLPSMHDIDLFVTGVTLEVDALGFKLLSVASFPYAHDVTIQRFRRGKEILDIWSTRLTKAELKKLSEKFLALSECVEE